MARQWMKFFLDAGISKDTSAEYALEFESNRMEMSLLGDLDKDCLRFVKIKYFIVIEQFHIELFF